MGKSAHVTRGPGKGWKVVSGGKTISRHHTQAAAQKAGRNALKKAGGGELATHGMDNLIRQKNTIAPAKDPHPPRG